MRRLLPIAGFGPIVCGVAACSLVSPPPAIVNSADWRMASGQPVSEAQFGALRNSCASGVAVAAIDPRATVESPSAANPAFHPGGVGLLNATPTGLASWGAPVGVETTRVERSGRVSLGECLESKGLVRVE